MTTRFDDRAIRGVPWAALSFGANKVITLGTTFVLARLLAPADFGVVALALLTIGVLTVFGNLGLSGALILRQDLDARGKGTVLTLMVTSSALMALLTFVGAPAVAWGFEEPRLEAVLMALALAVLPSGVTWFYEGVMQREMEFRSRFVAQAVQSCSFAAVGIGAAVSGAGVWSLVAAQVVSTIFYAVALLVVTPERVRLSFDPPAARAVGAMGSAFMAQGGLAFLKQNVDYLAVGRVLGASPLGLYSVGYRLAELPYWAIADPVAKVTFPAFAKMRARGEDVTVPFLSALQAVALVSCPVGILLSGAADPFTRAILGERWLPMIAPLTVLGLWGAVRPVHGTIGWLFNSVGMASLLARVSAATLLFLVPAIFVAAGLGGITAVAGALLIEMLVASVALAVLAERRLGITVRSQWKILRSVIAGSAVAWITSRTVSVTSGVLPDVVRLVAAAGLGAVAYVLVVMVLDRGVLRRSLRQVRRMVSPGPTRVAVGGPGEEIATVAGDR